MPLETLRSAPRWLSVLVCALLFTAAAQAQVARVIEARGAAMVERAGQPPRLLGAGERLDARDTISVAPDSWAIVEFTDQTRITLRPNTVFRIDAYSAGAPESALMGLLKGGFRAVTGWIGKRNPQAMLVRTPTATIGIQGTEFDARLCEADCVAEARAQPTMTAHVGDIAARVVELKGFAAAAAPGAGSRLLARGAALHVGDGVATGPGSYAVLVFRDGARVSLEGNSRLAINHFRFRESSPAQGSAYLTLYAGQAHVWTGRLAKISPDAFLVRSAIGVIRPHGTGFSVSGCIGNACASVSGNVDSSGASGSASASAGGNSASTSGSAGSGGASGTTTVSGGGQTASASGSAGSGGAGATFVTPVGASSGSVAVGSGGVTQTSSGPLGNSTTTIGPGGVSSSGSAGSASVNVGSGGVSAGRTVNVPGGSSVTVGGSVGAGGASASVNTPVGTASESVTVGPGGVTQTSSGPLGNSTTTIGPGGISSSGSAGSASVNVGSGGVSASRTVNVPGGSSLTVNASAPPPPLPGGGSVAPLPSPPGGGSAPPPPPPAGEVVNEVKDTGQNLVNTGQNAANNAATNTQNTVNAVMQGAQDVVAFVSRETESQASAGAQRAGQLGQAAQDSFASGTQAAITRVQDTFSQGAQAAGQQAANAGAALNDARTSAAAGANQVSDAAAQQAVNALNAATAPIVAEMTALMTQLRSNPPQTEAQAQQMAARIGELSQLMSTTVTQAANAAGDVAQSEPFRSAVGLALAGTLIFEAEIASATVAIPGVGPAISAASSVAFQQTANAALATPYLRDSLASVGLTQAELVNARNAGSLGGAGALIQTEVASHLATQGSAAGKSLFAEAQALAATAQQRAQQEASHQATNLTQAARQGATAAGAAGDAANRAGDAIAAGASGASAAAEQLAVNALNAAAAPIVAEMTALIARLRNNPPQTEAEAQLIQDRLQALSAQMNNAVGQTVGSLSGVAQSDAALAAGAMYLIQAVAAWSAFSEIMIAAPFGTGMSQWAQGNIQAALLLDSLAGSPGLLRGLDLIGINQQEFNAIRNEMVPFKRAGRIEIEIGGYLASSGTAAARAFFDEVHGVVDAMQQSVEQDAARARTLAEQELAETKVLSAQSAAGVAPPGESITSLVRELLDQARDSVSALRASPDPVGDGLQRLQALREDLRRRSASTSDPGLQVILSRLQERLDGLYDELRNEILERERRRQNDSGVEAASSANDWAIVGVVALCIVEIVKQIIGQYEVAGSMLQPAVEAVVEAIAQAANEAQNPDATLVTDALAAMGSLRGLVSSGVPATSTAPVVESASRLLLSAATRNRFDERDLSQFAERLTQLPAGGADVVAIRDNAARLMVSLERAGKISREDSARFVAAVAPNRVMAVSRPLNPNNHHLTASVTVLDGEVEVIGRARVRRGEMLASAGAPVRIANLPAIQDVKVDPNLFGGGRTDIDAGLYVWVRDGAVQLAKDGQTVDVAAGNAAVATKDRVRLLDVVPSFLRFDPTPVSAQGAVDQVAEIFRAGDGSLFGSCKVQ